MSVSDLQDSGSGAGTVVVPHDPRHFELLDRVADSLVARGYAVHRGTSQDAAGTQVCGRVSMVVATARDPVDAQTMSALTALHTIVVPTTGLEAVAVEAATDLGIAVANGATPENVVSIAESTFLLVMALLYRLPSVVMGWNERWPVSTANTLQGKTVGLIGYGGVAQAMVPRLQVMGATVLVHSARSGLSATGVAFVGLLRLVELADVVCVVGTLNDRTRHSIDAPVLARMKPGAFIVNTARGAIVDEAALCEALASGRIAGAALDAFETEPLPADSPLRALNNVILTPHCIGHTQELLGSFLPAILGSIDSARRGELPVRCKNPQVHGHWRRLEAIPSP